MGKLQNRRKKFWSLFDDTFEFYFFLEYFREKLQQIWSDASSMGWGRGNFVATESKILWSFN